MDTRDDETITLVVPTSSRAAFEAAVQTLQQRQPSENVDDIIVQLIISAATTDTDTAEDKVWDQLFERSTERQSRMVAALRREQAAGRTQRLDPERL